MEYVNVWFALHYEAAKNIERYLSKSRSSQFVRHQDLKFYMNLHKKITIIKKIFALNWLYRGNKKSIEKKNKEL